MRKLTHSKERNIFALRVRKKNPQRGPIQFTMQMSEIGFFTYPTNLFVYRHRCSDRYTVATRYLLCPNVALIHIDIFLHYIFSIIRIAWVSFWSVADEQLYFALINTRTLQGKYHSNDVEVPTRIIRLILKTDTLKCLHSNCHITTRTFDYCYGLVVERKQNTSLNAIATGVSGTDQNIIRMA